MNQMNEGPRFQTFQRAFGQHLRDPHHTPLPEGVSRRRASVYRELVFNNVCGFLDACFPVARATLGESRWRLLNRRFFRDWPLDSPWFRDIPGAYVEYIRQTQAPRQGPRWLYALLHYEWIELVVDIHAAPVPSHDIDGDLLAQVPLFNPTLQTLAYDWPVHKISPTFKPRRAEPTFVLVYRDHDDVVQFSLVNAVTYEFVRALQTGEYTGAAACRFIAETLNQPNLDAFLPFGLKLLEGFRQQGIILGTQT